jgi:hypothetical protein
MYTNDDLKNLSDEDKKRERNVLQMQVVILESDNRKFLTEKNLLDAEIRKLKIDAERLRISIDEKQEKLKKLVFELEQSEAEVKRIKKRINLVI